MFCANGEKFPRACHQRNYNSSSGARSRFRVVNFLGFLEFALGVVVVVGAIGAIVGFGMLPSLIFIVPNEFSISLSPVEKLLRLSELSFAWNRFLVRGCFVGD